MARNLFHRQVRNNEKESAELLGLRADQTDNFYDNLFPLRCVQNST